MYDNPFRLVQTLDGPNKVFLTTAMTAGILQGNILTPTFLRLVDYLLIQSVDTL